MPRKRSGRKTNHKSVRLIVHRLIDDTADPRTRYALNYRPDYKRAIERFFRLQSFSPKAKKKQPREQEKSVLRLSDFNAIVEAMRRRVDDQRQEHRKTLRKVGRNGK